MEHTMTARLTQDEIAAAGGPNTPLADVLIRDLVEIYPRTLGVLAPLGIDLCCGGGHPLGEALDLHGLDRDAVLPQVARVIAESDSEAR
jgi:iron-sulfur cluster repair protein YtfE (RIC family)